MKRKGRAARAVDPGETECETRGAQIFIHHLGIVLVAILTYEKKARRQLKLSFDRWIHSCVAEGTESPVKQGRGAGKPKDRSFALALMR